MYLDMLGRWRMLKGPQPKYTNHRNLLQDEVVDMGVKILAELREKPPVLVEQALMTSKEIEVMAEKLMATNLLRLWRSEKAVVGRRN